MRSAADANPNQSPPADGVRTALDGIPLALRMIVYGVSFLSLMLGLLPYAASRLDVLCPACHVEIPAALRVAGGAVFAAALALYAWSSLLLSYHGRGAYVEFDPPRQLVTTGPFSWCRNPIAACVVLMLLGLGLACSSTGILLLALIAVPIAHAQVVLLEEPLLRKRFGAAFDAHAARVNRWLPRPPRSP